VNGRTVYDCTPDEFVKHTKEFSELGGALFGGCCGTGPEHIAKIAPELRDFELRKPDPQYRDKIVCATEKEAFILEPGIEAGEIIECGPDLEEHIRKANKNDSQIITVKICCESDLDEFEAAQYAIRKPLCIVCDDAALLDEALMLYQGRALYAGELSDEELLPMVHRYGLII
jgi:5-methyltetrahydrofolate--homocysteine methyltransferase